MSIVQGDEPEQRSEMGGVSESPTITARLAKRLLAIQSDEQTRLRHTGDICVIVVSSRPDWTFACVRTLLQNTAQSVRIYIVPNVDDVRISLTDCYRAVESLILEDWKSVHVLRSKPGVDALNAALEQVNTEFFAVLQDHAFVPSQWLEHLLWPFYDDESIAVTAPTAFEKVPENLRTAMTTVSNVEDVNEVNRRTRRDRLGRWHEDSEVTSTCWIARRNLFREVGTFTTTLASTDARMRNWLDRVLQSGNKLVKCEDVYVYVLHLSTRGVLSEFEKPESHETRNSDSFILPFQFCETIGLEIPYGNTSPLVTLVILHSSQTEDDLLQTWQSVIAQTYADIETVLVVYHSAVISKYVTPDATLILHETKSLQSAWRGAQMLCHGAYVGFVETGTVLPCEHVYSLVDLLHRGHAIAGCPKPCSETSTITVDRIPLSGLFARRTNSPIGSIEEGVLDQKEMFMWRPSDQALEKIEILHRDRPYFVIPEV
ncbi:glycosyltransferase family 2 protein [Alicyclobacillus tolerans]|uniref:glycosyltransferase family 2 protein n=1 Tax=Alicyclobacillus tolerans TaxID=90970 RepID=UPI001F172E0B|nr:glycosyltransferase family 2 protein [Alicyclobacillus tolerans]MCF8567605.1 glycosyltransferase family 2 protein [Alicyclobacillus tolerans]